MTNQVLLQLAASPFSGTCAYLSVLHGRTTQKAAASCRPMPDRACQVPYIDITSSFINMSKMWAPAAQEDLQSSCPCFHEIDPVLDCRAGQRQKFALNSSDQVFHELRDLSFAAVGPELGKRTKGLRTDYQGSKGSDKRYAEMQPSRLCVQPIDAHSGTACKRKAAS